MQPEGHLGKLAGRMKVQAGVVLGTPAGELFIPTESIIEHSNTTLVATRGNMVCSFDLTRVAVATITKEGPMFTLRHATEGRTEILSVRGDPL